MLTINIKMGMIHSELSPFLFFLALFLANFSKIAWSLFAFFVILQQLKEEKYRS